MPTRSSLNKEDGRFRQVFVILSLLSYNFFMGNRLLVLKWLHSGIAFFMLGCLIYILYAGLTATFNIILVIAVGAILTEGAAISLNKWQCPLTTLAKKWGDEKGSVSDLFLPDIIARNLFKYSPFFFAGELILLGVRYFSH